MAEMAKTEEGLERINEGVDRYVAERVEEGDQHAPQGGLQVMRPTLYPFQKLFHSILLRLHCVQPHPPTLIHRLLRRQLNRV